jgi:hypothetical protein
MDYLKTLQLKTEMGINQVLANPYIMTVLKLSLTLYASQIAPRAPDALQKFFSNVYAKIFLIFIIVYLSEKDFQLAILIAVIFVLSMNALSGRGLFESFADYTGKYIPEGGFTLIEPKTMIYPGCHNITMDDLYKMFDGDKSKMQSAVQYSFKELVQKTKSKDSKELLTKIAYSAGLPYNLSFDKPETAPYIATLLVNYGYNIKGDCQPPYK